MRIFQNNNVTIKYKYKIIKYFMDEINNKPAV